jgi:predicted transcriptional regulator
MKELVMEVTNNLPDTATIEEIFDAVLVRLCIEKGLKDIEDGKTITTEELLKEIETW